MTIEHTKPTLQPPRRIIPPPALVSRRDEASANSSVVRDVGVVIVAGGGGSRAGGELKQFRWVAGKPALLHSVQAFMARADVGIVVVVLPKAYAADPPPWLFQCDVDRLLALGLAKKSADRIATATELAQWFVAATTVGLYS